ncbi:MAG: hypothetical protein ACE5LU_09415 [Anaerolineae bacterium]
MTEKRRRRRRLQKERLPVPDEARVCAWCKKPLPARDVYGLGARAVPGIELPGPPGTVQTLWINSAQREVHTIIVTKDSPAKQQEGWDFYFALCSETCANELRTALVADGIPAGR